MCSKLISILSWSQRLMARVSCLLTTLLSNTNTSSLWSCASLTSGASSYTRSSEIDILRTGSLNSCNKFLQFCDCRRNIQIKFDGRNTAGHLFNLFLSANNTLLPHQFNRNGYGLTWDAFDLTDYVFGINRCSYRSCSA